MLNWYFSHRINDYSDFVGLIVTVMGFALTLWRLRKSRKLAEQAIEIAHAVREDIYKIDTISELSAALVAMEALKKYARLNAYVHLPDHLSDLKHRLARIRSSSALLSGEDKAVLQGAIAQFSALESKIDRAIEAGQAPTGWARDNSALSAHIDRVHSVLNTLRTSTGVSQ